MYSAHTHAYRCRQDSKPVVLTIAGSDCAGLAGIQMDVRCIQSFGVHAATALTAVTAQNSERLYAINPVSAKVLAQQIDAALKLHPQAIKIGMIVSVEQVDVLCEKLSASHIPVIFDPVMSTSSATDTLNVDVLEKIKTHLLPLCTVITPNIPEAESLSDRKIHRDEERVNVATLLLSLGSTWAVIKGGHVPGGEVGDLCYGPAHEFVLAHPRIDIENVRGTGCAYASFLAAAIALGYDIRDAMVLAKMAIQQGIVKTTAVNGAQGGVEPMGFPRAYWPHFKAEGLDLDLDFPACVGGSEPDDLGLYPIVDSAAWLSRLLPFGITTAQLRIKNLTGEQLVKEIQSAIAIGKQHNCRLFINDHWRIAIDQGAYGVHLGQEDIQLADLKAIQNAGLRLGVSNHCHYELVRSLAIKPSYIACGPIYATTTKDMPWVPHGIDGLNYWMQSLSEIPLVCIGGINEKNIDAVAATGVSGIALITAITEDKNPEKKLKQLMMMIENARAQQ